MADIVLKDRNGNNIEYPGVNHIKVKTTDGATKDFIARTPVETSVKLDFADGDMEVTPEAEELFSKVNIPVPANLIPENIAEGVDIAGIVGTLVAGGGSNLKIVSGSFSGNGGGVTVTHNLGMIPDIFLVKNLTGASNVSYPWLEFAVSTSSALFDLGVWPYARGFFFYRVENSMYLSDGSIYASVETTNAAYTINNATSETIVVGANSGKGITRSGYNYKWVAIGGLT